MDFGEDKSGKMKWRDNSNVFWDVKANRTYFVFLTEMTITVLWCCSWGDIDYSIYEHTEG